MESNLRQAIDRYLERVQVGIRLFKAQIEDTHPLRAWRTKQIPQKGRLSDDVTYSFHGIGCALTFPECVVDFDFGDSGRADGFDLWRLSVFVESCPGKFPCYEKEGQLEHDFKEAIRRGEIVKQEGAVSNLYYLV